MLTTVQIDSAFFRRLTGRLKPKLVHPTAKAFDLREWREVTKEDAVTTRDEVLLRTAAMIGMQMKVLREKYIGPMFGTLSRSRIVGLAVADANRAWSILRWKAHQALAEAGAAGGPGYFSVIGQIGIPVGPDGAMVTPADANNASVDSVPHWFAVAADAPAEDGAAEVGLETLMVRAQMAFNLEHAYRDVWQEVLWEPWGFAEDEQAVRLDPERPADMGRWRAWDWREQSLAMQGPIFSRNVERGAPDLAVPLARTAGLDGDGGAVAVEPTAEQSAAHRSAFEIIEKSYVADFLDQDVGGVAGMTPRLLEGVVCVLQDLLKALLPGDVDPATFEITDVDRLRCSRPRAELSALVAETLGIGDELADACLVLLSADPFGPLGPLFTTGLWHRPLVASQDGQELMIVAGALMWGSPVRRAERWLQTGGSADLSRTNNGLRFEAEYRARIDTAIRDNGVLVPTSSGVASIAAGQAAEEIDLLFRIGSTVVVGEVKCLLAPSEAIERYDYIRKLEEACDQAVRKAEWLAAHPEEAADRVGTGDGKLVIMPLVVVNQSNGVEWNYEGCAVTDTRFLELFLSAGSYNSAAALFCEEGRDPVVFTRELYADAAAAEAALGVIFHAIPGMDPFRDSIAWGETVIPLCDGRRLHMGHPTMDVAAYIAKMPNSSDLAPHGKSLGVY